MAGQSAGICKVKYPRFIEFRGSGLLALAKAEGFGSESAPMFTGTPARVWHHRRHQLTAT
ncbi:MAG: hypothetical protein DMG57_27865 [Acidobacteria bacterium]|nr:MAG: hypothetical protein DMG57_27865 [Acidobacteriota bacterium]